MTDLKRCPFCGAEPRMKHMRFDAFSIEFWWVKCENCRAEINQPRHSEKEAADDWNRRSEVRNVPMVRSQGGLLHRMRAVLFGE